jgi:flagellar motor switch protein FliM
MQELRPSIVGHENNGRFLQTAAHDTVMLCLSMEVRLGDCLEQMQLVFPYFTIESLVRKLSDVQETEKIQSKQAAGGVRWNSNLDDIRVNVTAEWQGLELTARELAMLKPGDVILLDPGCAEQVEVRLERIAKFRGRLGTRAQKWAVEIQKARQT